MWAVMAWGAGGEAGEAARFGWKGAEGGCEMSVSAPRSNHPEEFGRRRSAETQREWASDSEAYRLCRAAGVAMSGGMIGGADSVT